MTIIGTKVAEGQEADQQIVIQCAFTLRLKNPCVNSEFVSIVPSTPQLPTIRYKIGDQAQDYTGSTFSITASTEVLDLCYGLAVKA